MDIDMNSNFSVRAYIFMKSEKHYVYIRVSDYPKWKK